MRRLARLPARLLVVGLCTVIAGAVAAVGGAENPSVLRQKADALRRENTTLAQRMHATVLGLYSLDSQLQQARSQVASLHAKRERIARERHAILVRLDIARHDLRISQTQLAVLLHTLYEQQSSDPLAVVLGAQSLDEAIATLEDLSRSAQQQRDVARQSRQARSTLAHLVRALDRQDVRVRSLEAAVTRTESSLAAALRERTRYVSALGTQRHLNDAQIATLDARAQESVARTLAVAGTAVTSTSTAPAAAAPVTGPESPPASLGPRTLTVVATGYSASGTTATGLPTGRGVVAVDPSVIPLGTRMTIPGYGEGVAADTGSAVSGATVDLWFPTTAAALDWGRRVVTVTLH